MSGQKYQETFTAQVPIDDQSVTRAMTTICGRILAVRPEERQRCLEMFVTILRDTVQLASALDDVADPRPH